MLPPRTKPSARTRRRVVQVAMLTGCRSSASTKFQVRCPRHRALPATRRLTGQERRIHCPKRLASGCHGNCNAGADRHLQWHRTQATAVGSGRCGWGQACQVLEWQSAFPVLPPRGTRERPPWHRLSQGMLVRCGCTVGEFQQIQKPSVGCEAAASHRGKADLKGRLRLLGTSVPMTDTINPQASTLATSSPRSSTVPPRAKRLQGRATPPKRYHRTSHNQVQVVLYLGASPTAMFWPHASAMPPADPGCETMSLWRSPRRSTACWQGRQSHLVALSPPSTMWPTILMPSTRTCQRREG